MMSELFDEQALREQYDIASKKEAEARGEARGEARCEARGEARGVLKTLVSLFKKGLLTLSEASKQAEMSEKEFEALVASMQ